MGTFMAAYLAVWLAVVVYTARLATRQARLQRDMAALVQRMDVHAEASQSTVKAA